MFEGASCAVCRKLEVLWLFHIITSLFVLVNLRSLIHGEAS